MVDEQIKKSQVSSHFFFSHFFFSHFFFSHFLLLFSHFFFSHVAKFPCRSRARAYCKPRGRPPPKSTRSMPFWSAASVVRAAAARGTGLTGCVFVVTGASNGIGFECAKALISGGPRAVVVAARPGSKATAAVATLEANAPTGTSVYLIDLDLGDLSSVRACASQILALEDRDGKLPLHALINNAGLNGIPEWGVVTPGIETQFAVNCLGAFLLAELLEERILSTPGGRVVQMASEAHRRVVSWTPPPPPKERYDPLHAYAYSNLIRILWTRAKAKRVSFPVVCLHPGVVGGTGMLQHMTTRLVLRQVALVLRWELRGILKGQRLEHVAACQTWAAVAPVEQVRAMSGGYLNGNRNPNVPAGATWDQIGDLGRVELPSPLAQSDDLAEEVFECVANLMASK
jgi:NAD(P)-dependent dehydrogenase (short-subunit alcohol dehydrogenase family)